MCTYYENLLSCVRILSKLRVIFGQNHVPSENAIRILNRKFEVTRSVVEVSNNTEFCNKIIFSDEAHFHLEGYVNIGKIVGFGEVKSLDLLKNNYRVTGVHRGLEWL